MSRALPMILLVVFAVALAVTPGDAGSPPATRPTSAWPRPARRQLDPAPRERREVDETRRQGAETTTVSEAAAGSPRPAAADKPSRKRMSYRGLTDRVTQFAMGLDRLTVKLFRLGQGAADAESRTGTAQATARARATDPALPASEDGLQAVAVAAPEKKEVVEP